MFLTCVAYEHGRRLAEIPFSEVHNYTSKEDCFVWLALKDATAEEMTSLQTEFNLHPLAVEDASHGHQRPKIDEFGQSMFVVMHILEMDRGEIAKGEVAVFVGPQYVISVRRGSKLGFAELRRRSEEEPQLLKHGPVYVLYALMDTIVDRYFPVIDMLSQEIEGIEERIFSGYTTRVQVEALYGLKCKLMTVEHAAGSLLEVTGKLYGGRVPHFCNDMQEYFRDVADHLKRLNHSIDSLRDMVATAITVNLSLIALQESENTKRLAAYAALVAVPTMIAGIYGMNFEHMPELTWIGGYPLALGLMIALDTALFFQFRKIRWL